MKSPFSLKVTYTFEGQVFTETYKSLYACANKYCLNVPTLKSIISGHSKRNPFGQDLKFEITEPKELETTRDYSVWKCDLCDCTIKAGSKCNHLMSVKHRQKVLDMGK